MWFPMWFYRWCYGWVLGGLLNGFIGGVIIALTCLTLGGLGWQVKAHYEGAKNVVTLYCFPSVSMFEIQPW